MRGKVTWDKDGTRHYFMDGVEVTEAAFKGVVKPLDLPGGQPGASITAWKRPILSDALAVHPDQIPEAMERDRRHGIAVEYAPDGRPILRDRDTRRRMMASLGVHDRSGGYGDDHAKSDHPGYGTDTDIPDGF